MSPDRSQNGNFASEETSNENDSEAIPASLSKSEMSEIKTQSSTNEETSKHNESENPPLPEETIPPLPFEIPPSTTDPQDDGWDPVWDENAQTYYFYNRFTGSSQWTNPRVPESQPTLAPGVGPYDRMADANPAAAITTTTATTDSPPTRPYGGYDPAIHGDYDHTASYAQEASQAIGGDDGTIILATSSTDGDSAAIYTATGVFNRFTGKWQPNGMGPENHNDENKSKRQMSAFFDVDAAANSHNGKSLKAERSGKKLSKQELKAFKEKRKEKKEEKRRAWLRD